MAMSIMTTGSSIFSRSALLALKLTNLRAVRQAKTMPFANVGEGMTMDSSTNNATTSLLTPVKAAELFYSSINDKNLEQLRNLVAEDCFFEDTFFINQPRGKQEVMRFLERLTESMGSDIKFRVEQTAGGDGSTVGVTWHFAIRNQQVPFTRGCSFYEFSKDGDQLLIKYARAVIESAIKPGEISVV
ncbi:hypothetical protein LIER_15201 [Lithospermum erythrorhizon]|uniref:SnoaL-like domain-containing protein n=1 Tax=Lithospermum erythrorhizon TaxID=34254 RepID=A0AAV3Q218_LITER